MTNSITLTDTERDALRAISERTTWRFPNETDTPDPKEFAIANKLPDGVLAVCAVVFPDSFAVSCMVASERKHYPDYFAELKEYNPKVIDLLGKMAEGASVSYEPEPIIDPKPVKAKDAIPCVIAKVIVDGIAEQRKDETRDPWELVDMLIGFGAQRFEDTTDFVDSRAAKQLAEILHTLTTSKAKPEVRTRIYECAMRLPSAALQHLAWYANGDLACWEEEAIQWHLEAAGKALERSETRNATRALGRAVRLLKAQPAIRWSPTLLDEAGALQRFLNTPEK